MPNKCPVCGYQLDFLPWKNDNPADEICPSCGIQFGYDDMAGGDLEKRKEIYINWREKWLKVLNPQTVKDWLMWSQNKRVSSGWYFKEEDGKYVVGYYDSKKGHTEKLEYSDAKEACANFIKKEIEDIKR